MPRLGVVLLSALAAVVALACGSSESSEPAAPIDCKNGCWAPTPAEEAYMTEFCTLTESCCVANAYRDASDVEGCKAVYRSAGISADTALRAQCLAEMKSLAAAGIDCAPEAWDLSDACLRVSYEPSGPQAPGEPCKNRADCKGAAGKVTLCAQVSSEFSPTQGLCMRLTRGKAGSAEPCLGTVTPDGLIAAAALTIAGRATPVTTGPVCEERAGLQCGQGDNPTAAWTCVPLRADGAACNYPTTCASKQCLTSDGSEATYDHVGTCSKRVPAGQICGDHVSRAVCDDASYCVSNDDPNNPGGICQPKLPAGGACNGDQMCVSDKCDSDTTKLCSTQTSSEALTVFAVCARF